MKGKKRTVRICPVCGNPWADDAHSFIGHIIYTHWNDLHGVAWQLEKALNKLLNRKPTRGKR